MAENKTRKTGADVEGFLAGVDNARRKADSQTLLAMMKRITGLEPEMWGPSIVGFGSYHYRYDSGREGDMPMTGFSPRKQSLTVYVMPGFAGSEDLLARLGKHRTSVSCLYINKLAGVDQEVLAELIGRSFAHMRQRQC
ncbi:MAG: DUF1801 domain-containing protein [Spirochaetaceae bacterium]|nr:DUF1801 domain-containing protein [Spirochaetaceae bacterium]